MIDNVYWQDFAIKFARKRGVTNQETLQDIAQDALAKIYSLDLSRLQNQKEIERFVGRSVANMIRDWQRKEKLRTHCQLFDFTHHLNTCNNIEDYFVDYVQSQIPAKISFYNGSELLVDQSDYPNVCKYNWHLKDCGDKSYVRSWINSKHVYLHRYIASQVAALPSGAVVNFINGNTLDCRKSNLRIGNEPLEHLL